MPKIRHMAMICMDPEKLAKFYCEVFEMKEVTRATRNGRTNVFLTDGYINLALLSQKAEGKPNGLNHFGFHVEDADVIADRLKDWDVVGPTDRPADRVYAEQRVEFLFRQHDLAIVMPGLVPGIHALVARRK